MANRTFRSLLNGEIDYLTIALRPAMTLAKRDKPNIGLWRLSRIRFQAIAESIREKDILAGKPPRTPEVIADDCDKVGIENRFFRLNEEVAAWIDGTAPEPIRIDYILQ